MYAGTAIRMAQIMRLNKEFHQSQSLREQEIRRRTFWACVLMDRLLAYYFTKPLTICSDNIRIALPTSEASLAYEEATRGITLDSLGSYAGYPSEVGIMPYFIKTMFLWGNIVDINVCNRRFIDKTTPTDPNGWFYLRHQEMRDWMACLPPSLQWSQQNYMNHSGLGGGKEFLSMHFLIHSAFCDAHQSYLPQLDRSSILLDIVDTAGWSLLHREPSLVSTCVSSALALGEILTWLAKEDASRAELQSVGVAAALLSVCNTYLWLQYAGDPEFSNVDVIEKASSFFSLSLEVLASWERHWKIARQWVNTLKGMDAMYRAAYLAEIGESLPDRQAGAFSSDEDTSSQGYRPQAGNGYPFPDDMLNLFSSLRFIANDSSAKPKMVQSVWSRFAQGWPCNIFIDVPTDPSIG